MELPTTERGFRAGGRVICTRHLPSGRVGADMDEIAPKNFVVSSTDRSEQNFSVLHSDMEIMQQRLDATDDSAAPMIAIRSDLRNVRR